MDRGKVKWFNIDKGYGFITPDNGARDIFLHVTVMKRSGIANLEEGQQVFYKLRENDGRLVATEITTEEMA